MTYSVKEMFYTIQGEGHNSGRVAVFCRFSGCNLWSGLEKDRATAVCQFCDTQFVGTDGVGGGKFLTADELAQNVEYIWVEGGGGKENRFIVCTGGEPLLQLNSELLDALHNRGFYVAVETNGTKIAPNGIDWITVSPKSDSEIKLKKGNELKLVYPQKLAPPENFEGLEFDYFYLQPMDGPLVSENTKKVINFCKSNPKWNVSVQAHKILGIP